MTITRIPAIILASLLVVSISGCAKQGRTTATSAPGTVATAANTESAEPAREVVFQQKLACSNIAKSYGFVATSPREHPYVQQRNCYSATLNTCIVEYRAQDDSATIFDALTGEVLVEFLNYPGNADQINLAPRLGITAPPASATTTAEEGVTPQKVDYDRWSAHLFEGCAR